MTRRPHCPLGVAGCQHKHRDVSGWVALASLAGAGVCAFLVGLGVL